MKEETQTDVVAGQVKSQESSYTTEDVNVFISLTGQVEGIVVYSMLEEAAKTLVSQMMREEWPGAPLGSWET